MVYLTRRYRFSAAHRLHNEALDAEENARMYGKCNNPYGHGHNYVLEVTVVGEVDSATGMVCDLAVLNGAVQREVIDRFDETHLNLDVESFRTRVPTAENICLEIFDLLRVPLKGAGPGRNTRLERVRLEETSSNFFEYYGERDTRNKAPKVR
jgi:6-pyruvoyltetrahydropterin/6-carboxytetrahydropterin synthase